MSFIDDSNVGYFLQQIEEGNKTFEDVRELNPDLFDHPRMKDALASAFRENNMPKRKRGGRARELDLNVVELYGWAKWYYVRDGESWEAACDAACRRHKNLVPKAWGEDPGGNLKKEASRKLDKHPLYSQHSFRRDK